jgi:hypothetical protein
MPLPAMNRCLFFICDVFFLGTAFNNPSHMSANDGIAGSAIDGRGKPANVVGSNRNGCERRWSRGRFTRGRTGPWRAGMSACHSGGIGRASAIVRIGRGRCVRRRDVVGDAGVVLQSKCSCTPARKGEALAQGRRKRAWLRGCPFPASAPATTREIPRQRP